MSTVTIGDEVPHFGVEADFGPLGFTTKRAQADKDFQANRRFVEQLKENGRDDIDACDDSKLVDDLFDAFEKQAPDVGSPVPLINKKYLDYKTGSKADRLKTSLGMDSTEQRKKECFPTLYKPLFDFFLNAHDKFTSVEGRKLSGKSFFALMRKLWIQYKTTRKGDKDMQGHVGESYANWALRIGYPNWYYKVLQNHLQQVEQRLKQIETEYEKVKSNYSSSKSATEKFYADNKNILYRTGYARPEDLEGEQFSEMGEDIGNQLASAFTSEHFVFE